MLNGGGDDKKTKPTEPFVNIKCKAETKYIRLKKGFMKIDQC